MRHSDNILIKELDQHVKDIHHLLREMDPQQRLEYIKDMLPALLSFSHPAPSSAQKKLQEKAQSPLQTLTQRELQLIDDLAQKTESLYKAMNDGSFFA